MRELDKSDLNSSMPCSNTHSRSTHIRTAPDGWEQDEIKYAKRPILEAAIMSWGWFYREKLASMIVVYSMKVNIHDNIMDMGGITGVATYPEYTGRGLIHSR